jgi:hypothetical protein
MSPPCIIGLLGRSRSGKDTVAGILKDLFPAQDYSVVRLSAPIKDAARALFQLNDDQLEGGLKEVDDVRWGISPRKIFQTITDDTMKYMGADFFTRLLYSKYDNGFLGKNIILPDIRYAHDIDEIHRRGGVVLKIVRDALPVRYACEDHIDAVSLPTIYNSGSMETLTQEVKKNTSQWNDPDTPTVIQS